MRKIRTYEEYNFECLLNESIVLYSNKLIKVLKRIIAMNDIEWNTDAFEEGIGEDSTIRNGRHINGRHISREVVQEYAKSILDKMYTIDDKVNYLYFDLDNDSNITYVKTNTLKSDNEKEILQAVEVEQSQDNINKLLYIIDDKFKETIKLGRLFKAIGMNNSPIIIDELVKRIKNYNNVTYNLNELDLDVVQGDDIKHWYDIKNCVDKSKIDNINKLHDTCMVIADSSFFDIYTNNPKNINLIVVKDSDKLVSRTLLWKTDTGNYIDTIYSANQAGIDKISEYIKANNLTTVPDSTKISLEYVPTLDDKFPFIDTMCYLDLESKILSNSDLNKFKLQDDKGGYSVYIDGDYITNDSIEYGITKSGENGFIKKSLAVFSDNLNVFIDERIIIETEDDEIYHIYCDEVKQLDPSIYGEGEYVMSDETIVDYKGRIIDEDDSTTILLSETFIDINGKLAFPELYTSIVDIRKNGGVINVTEIEKTSFYKYYLSVFGDFLAISENVVTNINDKYVLTKYVDCEFVKVNDTLLTKDIADAFNITYDNIFKGEDIFDIFNTLKENGEIIGIKPSELVKKIPKGTLTHKMFLDLTKTRKGIKY